MELKELEQKLGRLAYEMAKLDKVLQVAQAERNTLQKQANLIANQIDTIEKDNDDK